MNYSINKTKFASQKELDQLIDKLSNDNSRDAVLIKLAIATGARAQELLNIFKSDLDDDNRSVYIRGLKQSDDREIPLEKSLYNAVKAVSLHSNSERIFDIGYERLHQIWDLYRGLIGNKPFKALRHTFAIQTLLRYKEPALIKAALGHRSWSSTNVYTESIYKDQLLKKLRK